MQAQATLASHSLTHLHQPVVPDLAQMTARHEAIARYRIVLFTPSDGYSKKTQDSDLAYKEAITLAAQLNKDLYALLPGGVPRFSTPSYEIELENTDECLTPQARERIAICRGRAPRKQAT